MSEENISVISKEGRERWIDNIKLLACFFVVIGHFFQSMDKYGYIRSDSLFSWFNSTIYLFHTQLFFICSGYLYQQYSKIFTIKEYITNIKKKFIVLGIPYFVFTCITLILKRVASGNIISNEKGFLYTLFIHPTSPYWFLYTLFFCFVFIIVVQKDKYMYIYILLRLYH